MTDGHPIDILLVDDDPGDVLLTLDSLADSKLANRIYVVQGGKEALAFLRRVGDALESVHPGLILLDCHLRVGDGSEVLAEIKQDPNLSDIPVVMITGTSSEAESLRARGAAADAFMTKPIDLHGLAEVVRAVRGLHLTIVRAGA